MSTRSFDTVFVERLLFGLLNAQLYGTSHARVREGASDAAAALSEHCAQVQVPSVLLAAVAGLVVMEGRPVLGASLSARRLLHRITGRGAGGVEFLAAAGPEEVLALLKVLVSRGGEQGFETANRELTALGVSTIRFVPPCAGGGSGEQGGDGLILDVDAPIFSLHQQAVDLVQSHALSVCLGRDLDLGEVGQIVDGLLSGLVRDAGFLHSLAHHPEHDFMTFGHVIRVSLLALEVGRAMRHDEESLRRLGTAALLHDIGKARIPWEILHKRGPLDAEERRVMEQHPFLGASILLENRESDEVAIATAYGHHCTYDGRGRAWTCGEHEASQVTRLVTICDCFEQLTAHRPWEPAMTPSQAYRTMVKMTGHFDPVLLAHFVRTIGIYRPGTTVPLNDGSLGRVLRQTADLERPVVRLLQVDGGDLGPDDRRDVDLSAPAPGDPTAVVVVVPQDPLAL